MRILGIDPGTAVTGIGIIDFAGSKPSLIHFESLHLRSSSLLTTRLKIIYDKCLECIEEFSPDLLAVETAFYGKNIQSTLKLGQARGVAIIAGLNSELDVFEYSPREIKKSVTGSGASSKHQVHYMVKAILGIREELTDYDCTDALAVALCHVYRFREQGANHTGSSGDWAKFIRNNPERILSRK
ncbi:MAG: crossover junction endodeoxyribonuclease RuvC [Ignavibacteria bacterium]|nr:crossover junction endodeoxyribonuclease RuvC [Ignavibacteria bacterium]